MRESLKDPLRLEHIRDAIDRLMAADADKSFDLLNDKDIEYFGVVKLLEIIGEASYGLTRAALAKLIGVSSSRISDYLSGKSEPTLKVGRLLSQKFDIDPTIVLGV